LTLWVRKQIFASGENALALAVANMLKI